MHTHTHKKKEQVELSTPCYGLKKLTKNSNKHYHISQAKQELLFFLVCSFIYIAPIFTYLKVYEPCAQNKKDKWVSIKSTTVHLQLFQASLTLRTEKMPQSCKTVLKIILHAGLHDPITLGYEWFYQARFCNWSLSTVTYFDSIAQLCQSSKQPGCSFHGSVSTFVYCINLSCNFIKQAVSIISSYKHLAALQILKSGLSTTSPECECLECLCILPVNKNIQHLHQNHMRERDILKADKHLYSTAGRSCSHSFGMLCEVSFEASVKCMLLHYSKKSSKDNLQEVRFPPLDL